MLSLYRTAIRLRPRDEGFAWREGPPGTMIFDRGELTCLVNFDGPELELPAGELVLASEPGITTTLPPNTGAWIKRGAGR
jgi:alpha-glucosidase